MDAPWRMRSYSVYLGTGSTYTELLNPRTYVWPWGGSSTVNQTLSTDVDTMYASLWWFEPNLGVGETPASIAFQACDTNSSLCYTAANEPGKQRIRLGNIVRGRAWELRLFGQSVPASTNPDYLAGLPYRKVYVSYYWEDRDRDDADGPGAEVQ